jgi:WD40 repeat protein
MEDGVRLWELAGGRELTHLPGAICWSVFFQPNGRELLLCGPDGLRRCAVRQDVNLPTRFHFGPLRTVPLPVVPTRACPSADGRTVAIVSEAAGTSLVVDLATETVRGAAFRHGKDACFVALSPDGRYLATSSWQPGPVKIWNVPSGALLKELPFDKATVVQFTPDSRTLITCCHNEYCFWEIESWRPRRLLWERQRNPGRVAFSPDRRLMALELAPGVISLIDAARGRTLARLEDPFLDFATWLDFTPDGTQLVTLAHTRCVHIWDLRAVRTELVRMGLDW